jgi:predicted phosphodiesterase
MKYLIFSDTHLTPKFDAKKFGALKKAIDQADRVFINGDFWEGFVCTFDEFVASHWSKTLFPLLKKKKTIYMYGNHDKESWANSKVSLFSDKQYKQYNFKSGKYTYHIEHGDLILVLPDLPWFFRVPLERVENFIFKVLGKFFIRLAYTQFNDHIKKKMVGKYKENEFLITGHSHFAEINLEKRYLNSGFNNYGISQVLYIEDGKATAVENRY